MSFLALLDGVCGTAPDGRCLPRIYPRAPVAGTALSPPVLARDQCGCATLSENVSHNPEDRRLWRRHSAFLAREPCGGPGPSAVGAQTRGANCSESSPIDQSATSGNSFPNPASLRRSNDSLVCVVRNRSRSCVGSLVSPSGLVHGMQFHTLF
jgi:hypothetical protein